jgi:dynein light intermediate chain, axonemal
MVSCGHKL